MANGFGLVGSDQPEAEFRNSSEACDQLPNPGIKRSRNFDQIIHERDSTPLSIRLTKIAERSPGSPGAHLMLSISRSLKKSGATIVDPDENNPHNIR